MYEPDNYGYGEYAPPGNSGIGITSFLISLAGAAVMISAFGWVAYVEMNNPGRLDNLPEDSLEFLLMGLAVLGSLGAEVVALVLGIVALCQLGRSKGLAILGVIFSGGTLALLAGLIVVGLFAG